MMSRDEGNHLGMLRSICWLFNLIWYFMMEGCKNTNDVEDIMNWNIITENNLAPINRRILCMSMLSEVKGETD